MKLLISSFFLLIFISTSAHGASRYWNFLSDILLHPFVFFIIGALLTIIFAAALFILMFSTLLCIGLIGLILISIFFSEKKTLHIEKFLSGIIGMPPIKKFLFGKINGDEFKDHCIALIPFTILFLFGFVGLDLWINLFNYQFSFFKNETTIFWDLITKRESRIDDKSIIGSKNIYLIFYIIIPYFLIGLIRFIWTSSANISQKEKEETDNFYSSIFSSFFSSMYSEKSKKKKHSEKSKKKDDIKSRLEKLKKLLDEHAISKEEYEEQRKKIIGDV